MDSKVCTKCKEEKSLDCYSKDKSVKSGIRSYCQSCSNIMRKNWIDKNKDKEKLYNKESWIKTKEKYIENQVVKQQANKCLECGCSLLGRQLLAKYCFFCKKEVVKDWKKESYKRNIDTVLKYNSNNRDKINFRNNQNERQKRLNLSDRYVKKLLIEKNGFTSEQLKINLEIIEIKRLIIKTKRL